jgi:hypothetical protein
MRSSFVNAHLVFCGHGSLGNIGNDTASLTFHMSDCVGLTSLTKRDIMEPVWTSLPLPFTAASAIWVEQSILGLGIQYERFVQMNRGAIGESVSTDAEGGVRGRGAETTGMLTTSL